MQYGYQYKDLYEMTLKELTNTLKQRNEMTAYTMWKQSYLICLGIGDILSDKKSLFPTTPQEACPEMFPHKAKIKKPNCLLGKQGGNRYG